MTSADATPTPAPEPHDNPFVPGSPDGPFTGRKATLARIHRHLTDAPRTAPLVVTGRPHTGKTALLRRFIGTDENIIGVYISCARLPCHDESVLLVALSQQIVEAVQEHGFVTEAHLRSPDRADMRGWLADVCLPVLYRAIWRRRRIALLIDDAGVMLSALSAGTLPEDLPTYLHGLLGPQFGVALALDDAETDLLSLLVPLVPSGNVSRLGNLPVDAIAALCAGWLSPCAESLAPALHAASGGEPLLVQRFGHALVERRQSQGGQLLAEADVKAVAGTVYTAAANDLRRTWDALDATERQVLAAIGQLRFDDPLRRVDTSRIEAWLVQTDVPLDSTAINAALRGLEYRELVSGAASDVDINGGLLQRWLIEHASVRGAVMRRAAPAGQPEDGGRRLLWAALLAAVLLVLIVAVVSLSSGGEGPDGDAVPTVTLVPPGS